MPRVLGSLNIKKTADLNAALLVKLAWRMLCEPDALWVRILKHKYFPNSHPLIYATKHGSWVWKGIYKGLQIIKENYCWKVGDGKLISIWDSKWIPNRSDLVSPRFRSTHYKTVDQLITPGTNTWDIDILNALFDCETVNEICKIRIPMKGNDTLRWTPSSNDIFSVKTAHETISSAGHDANLIASRQNFP